MESTKETPCKNFKLCGAETVPNLGDGLDLCTNCRVFNWGELTFLEAGDQECPVCFSTTNTLLQFPAAGCRHAFCTECSRHILFIDDSRYHLSPVPYGCPPCPNGCTNPTKGPQCCCDESYEVQDKWEAEHPDQFEEWSEAGCASYERGEPPGSCYSTQQCPLCRRKYVSWH